MSARVVGLDLSLTGTGVATADSRLLTIRSHPGGETVADRVERLTDIAATISDHLDGADMVVIEGPAYSQQAQPGHHLRAGLWWWVADLACAHDAEVIEVTPSALKKFATGRGNATKADMRVALLQRTGEDIRDDNQADAYWLRQIGLHLLGDPTAIPLPRTHLATLAKITRGNHT